MSFMQSFDSSGRALDENNEPYPTKCFEGSLALMPQHHLLICGHHIKSIGDAEPCGKNCTPSASAERKVRNSAFACPVAGCAQERTRVNERNKCLLVKPGQTRARFRRCNLSQDLRFAEQNGMGASTGSKYRVRAEKPAPRRRSRSPRRDGQREEKTMDPAEVINALAASDEGYRIAVERFTGPGVRAKKDGRLKTRKDLELELKDKAVARALNNIHVLDTDEFEQRLKAARKRELAMDPNFGAADKEFGETKSTKPEDLVGAGVDTGLDCSVCGERAQDIAYKCLLCPDFVFCNHCIFYKRQAHPTDDYHKFGTIKPSNTWDRAADGEMDDEKKGSEVPYEPASFCKCETTDKRFLVSCDGDDCPALFHPGCLGRGIFANDMYEQDSADYYLRKDKIAHSRGRVCKCDTCHEEAVPAESDASRRRSARVMARAKARAEEAQKKATKKVYNVYEQAAKDEELKRAKTDQEKAVIEAKWEEIADDVIDVDQGDQDAPIQTYSVGPIAFHFKPQ